VLSNQRNADKATGISCPIYDNCSIVGYGTYDQATASTQGHSGGCVASSGSSREPLARFGLAGGVAALAVLRAARSRRRVSRMRKG
jgi:hypothetical protein